MLIIGEAIGYNVLNNKRYCILPNLKVSEILFYPFSLNARRRNFPALYVLNALRFFFPSKNMYLCISI